MNEASLSLYAAAQIALTLCLALGAALVSDLSPIERTGLADALAALRAPD